MCCLNACSIFSPNPGENEADTFIKNKQYDKAIAIIEPLANQGVPWAELRLGIAYEYGQGKTKDSLEALNLYHKAALKMQDNAWADGLQVLSAGDSGYFNQNNDAKVAQYLLARLYYQGARGINKDLTEAWRWLSYAQKASGGKDILFCCENSKLKAQYITQERLSSLLSDIEKAMPAAELEELKANQENWRPH